MDMSYLHAYTGAFSQEPPASDDQLLLSDLNVFLLDLKKLTHGEDEVILYVCAYVCMYVSIHLTTRSLSS